MSYVESSLLAGERVIYSAKLHWVMYVPHVLLMLVLVGFVSILWPIVRQYTTELVVTNRRVIAKDGLIARRTLEMNLSKIETIGVEQTVVGRILNYGNVVVVGTGGTQEAFSGVAKPIQFRREVQSLMN